MNSSPYLNANKLQWNNITEELIQNHPLEEEDIVTMILSAWNDIFTSSFGTHKIGESIFPKPQVIGAILHELIPAEMSRQFPNDWRGEVSADDKDIVYIPDDFFSIELKTSSNRTQKTTSGKKGKDGFYIAVNFEKFSKANPKPQILMIRFGWLDHSDWIGQASETGQQARLSPETYELKFKILVVLKKVVVYNILKILRKK